jgi:NAD(P)-dependent dehydrogenase (short-subunit alcohol dehydrogenase family)
MAGFANLTLLPAALIAAPKSISFSRGVDGMKHDLFNMAGKTALITGASRGIGRSIATILATHGAKILLVSRKADDLESVAQEITSAHGKALVYPCNMSRDEDIDALIAKVKSEHPCIDVLVNNAATNPFFGPILDASREAWDKTMSVNLRSIFFLTQGLVPIMKAGSSIINVASVNGISPIPMQSIYSISKAGLLALTKSFAKELAPRGIRVNTLTPGLTATKFASAMVDDPKIMGQLLPRIPLGRAADPDEMAGAVLYLASLASSYTTGSNLVVDGGASC